MVGELDARVREAPSTFDVRGNHNIYLKVDIAQVGFLDGVVHELLHAVLRKEMGDYDNEIEEGFIVFLESALIERITKSKFKTRVWRKAITLKLEER